MNHKTPKLLHTSVAVGATALAAGQAQTAVANITSATLNLVSPYASNSEYAVLSYDPNSFALSGRIGGQPVSTFEIAAISGYAPGKGNFGNQLTGISPSFDQISSTPLTAGDVVDSATSWSLYYNFSSSLSDTYFGLRFDAGSGNYNYGWVEIATSGGTDAIIVAAGVENNPNTSILAGETAPVPEPSSFALLALAGGSVALIARRNNRRATITR